MTSGVGTISAVSGGPSAPVVAVPSVTAQEPLPATPTAASTLVHNPRVLVDPSAGFITEYLNANGSQVVSQSPSAITVAYLRLGLTADGLTKKANTDQLATSA